MTRRRKSEDGYRSASPLDGVDVDGPLRALRYRTANESFPQMAQFIAKKYARLPTDPRAVVPAAPSIARYMSAFRARNWLEADGIYMAELRHQNRGAFMSTLFAEGDARAFNRLLMEELASSNVLLRSMTVAELPSYEGGTFESRREIDGGRRGYKAFSLYENVYSAERPVTMSVPISEDIRRLVSTATYTALPRPLQPSEERMGDGKHVTHAGETECRLPDGTPVPPSTMVQIKREKLDPGTDMAELISVCNSLDMNVSFI